MTSPSDCFAIYHGKLKVNVPYDLFDSNTAEIDPQKLESFKKTMMTRYPWISENAVKVIMNNAQKEMLRMIEERRRNSGVRKIEPVKTDEHAIAEARRDVERNPKSYAAWMRLGEILCRSGNTEEGYKAINKANSLIE